METGSFQETFMVTAQMIQNSCHPVLQIDWTVRLKVGSNGATQSPIPPSPTNRPPLHPSDRAARPSTCPPPQSHTLSPYGAEGLGQGAAAGREVGRGGGAAPGRGQAAVSQSQIGESGESGGRVM